MPYELFAKASNSGWRPANRTNSEISANEQVAQQITQPMATSAPQRRVRSTFAEAKAISAKVDRTLLWGALVAIGWVICCATCSFALISLFVRFAGRHPLLDAFANNSYGIYLIHYPFVTWTQYELLHVHISPILKGVSVVVVAIGSAWAAAAALRRIPAIRRIV